MRQPSVRLAIGTEALRSGAIIIRDGAPAGDVISRIRALFGKTGIAKERLDLNELIEEVVSLSRMEMDKKRVVLSLGLASNRSKSLGDHIQLQQVVINLILNGIEAMSDIELRPPELVIETGSDSDGRAPASISDAGVGLGSVDIGQLFIAFQSTKPNGLGIGLSISRSIIEEHGGRLRAEANPDSGARFSFKVPAASLAA